MNEDRHGVQYDPHNGQNSPASNDSQIVELLTGSFAHFLTPPIDQKEVKP
jgi:hypothetical protein